MLASERHIACAAFNESFAEKVRALGPECLGWAVVALFYAALHLVDAYIVSKNLGHPQTHTGREKYLAWESVLKPIYEDYHDLRHLSNDARYEAAKLTQDDFDVSVENLDRIKVALNPELSSSRETSSGAPK